MTSALTLESRFVGGLPLVNAILERVQVDHLLARPLPPGGWVSAAQALGVLLRNILSDHLKSGHTWTAQNRP